MTEIQQLREELARLRERVAVLEARPIYAPMRLSDYPNPLYAQPTPKPWHPPEVICQSRQAISQ